MKIKLSILDEVLSALHEFSDDKEHYIKPEELYKYLDQNEMSIQLVYLALEKLYKDGYALQSFQKRDGEYLRNRPTYYISFDGIFFLKSGGYCDELKSIKRKRYLDRLLKVTAVIGTGLAGLYGLFEIGKYIITLYSC